MGSRRWWPESRRGPELGQVALGDPAAVAGLDQAADAIEQAGLGSGAQVTVAGVGEQHLPVAGGGVRLVPLVAAERYSRLVGSVTMAALTRG